MGQIYLIDAYIHLICPLLYADSYEERWQATGQPQKHLSKEFSREWLISNGLQDRRQAVPPMDEARAIHYFRTLH